MGLFLGPGSGPVNAGRVACGAARALGLADGAFSLNGPALAPANIEVSCAAVINWLY
jgi:hypothetical protein